MKSIAIFVVLGLVLAGSVEIGQAQAVPAKPAVMAPTSTPPAADLALTKLKLAIAKAQIAGANAQQAQQQAQQAVTLAQQLIESTKKELGLPASYQWDFQAETFVQGPSQGSQPGQQGSQSGQAPPSHPSPAIPPTK